MLMSVIFDMDGVIIDSHPAHMRAWKKFLLSLGKPVTDTDLEFVRRGTKRQEILRYFLGDLMDDQIQAYGRQKDLLFQQEAESIKTVPGIENLLEELNRAGVPMALASCAGRGRVDRLLSLLQLTSYFSAVVTGDEVTLGKPNPEIFHKAAQQMHVHPAETIVFEDSVSGVQGARAAGMKCIGIAETLTAPVLLQAGADHVLPNFSDVSWIKIQKLFVLGRANYPHEPFSHTTVV